MSNSDLLEQQKEEREESLRATFHEILAPYFPNLSLSDVTVKDNSHEPTAEDHDYAAHSAMQLLMLGSRAKIEAGSKVDIDVSDKFKGEKSVQIMEGLSKSLVFDTGYWSSYGMNFVSFSGDSQTLLNKMDLNTLKQRLDNRVGALKVL